MHIKLISYSQGVTPSTPVKVDAAVVNIETDTAITRHVNLNDEHHSLQDLIAYCARVSNPANQNNTETNERLIRYLIKNQHWSPLEMVHICLEIETTRDIARQILRHRSFSFQEFSQRYAIVENDVDKDVIREARLQDTKNRQNSIETEDTLLQEEWDNKQNEILEKTRDVYHWALKQGIAKEQARVVLPEGLTVSRMYMSGSLRSWLHYIQLRSGNGTQKEHREVAQACSRVIETVFPMIREFCQ
jgi:thymidylate synthase (FAD)